MASGENIAIALRYYEECANDYGDPEKKRAMEAADRLLTDDFLMSYNNHGVDDADVGRDEHKQFLLRHTRGFPGERWTIEAAVADDQTVACQWHLLATHAETGNTIDLRAADFFTVREGRLAALRRFLDFRDLDEQRAAVVRDEASLT